MALTNCPECGREVSDRAEACPHCGNPLAPTDAAEVRTQLPSTLREKGETDEKKRPWYNRDLGVVGGYLAGMAAVAALVALVALLSPDAPGSNTAADFRPKSIDRPTSDHLGAIVRFTGAQLVITNNDAFNWSNCELAINSGIVRGGYEMRASLIEWRSTYTVGAVEFAKSSGERFNPFSMKPNNFWISCDTPRGRRYYSGEW